MGSSTRAWALTAVAAVAAVAMAAIVPISSAATVYTVGDSIGWTILNNPNYTAWALGKTFYVGDTLDFKYNKQYHNVLEVRQSDYAACKNGSALSEFTSGNDSVVIDTAGHHYYICGVPGHCQVGQKLDILAVAEGQGGATASPPPPSSTTTSSGSVPAPSAASRRDPPVVAAGLYFLLAVSAGLLQWH
ncbi:Mavicyanin [Apostasia shenzhenica]|uniref:Mavicyanin n=1 Tax=Apostasia shenzhenica TaxID=1088818 RepID=A0A2I0AAH9_9ASPA|nr:Mavicyanin [Apostasia shenzhenica]